MSTPSQLIDQKQWDEGWKSTTVQNWQPLDSSPTPGQQAWAAYLLAHVSDGAKVLEIGCGNSHALPFLARVKKAEVWGIDFAPNGLESAQYGLDREGVSGKLVLGDALARNDLPDAYFDIVLSMGVIEHFPPPTNSAALSQFGRYLQPNGRMITEIPNMVGFVGMVTRSLDRDLYDQHIRLDKDDLDRIHLAAGLEVVDCARYIGGFDIYTLNHDRLKMRLPKPIYWPLLKSAAGVQRIYRRLFVGHDSQALSPYTVGTYRKPLTAPT